MAKSREPGALPAKLPASVKRVVSARAMRDGTFVLQAPPKKRGPARSGWPYKNQLLFAWVEKQTRILEPRMRQTCEELARNTVYTWRDIATMMILGTYYAIELPDGTLIEGARMSNPDPQYILDLVTQVVGSILYRADVGWIGLAPGTAGDVLTQGGSGPAWAPPTGGGGATLTAEEITAPQGVHVAFSGTSLGANFTSLFALWLPAGIACTGVRFFCMGGAGGATVKGALYDCGPTGTGSGPLNLLASDTTGITPAAGVNSSPFAAPFTTTYSGYHFAGWNLTGSAMTVPNSNNSRIFLAGTSPPNPWAAGTWNANGQAWLY